MNANRTDVVTLAVLLLAFGGYGFTAITTPISWPAALGETFGLYIGLTVAMVLFHVVGAVSVALAGGGDVTADRAREREIGRRAARNGYFVVMMGLWALPFLMLADGGGGVLVRAVVGLLGAAEIVRYASRIAYRGFGGAQNQWLQAS